MNITKSLQRIIWRLSNGWKANQNDIDAINEIVEYVNNRESRQFENQILFAKLYVHVYSQFLTKYKATVFDEVPQKEFHKFLIRPFQAFIEDFTRKLNDSEQYELLNSLGISDKHGACQTQEEKRKDASKLLEAIKDENAKKQLFGTLWDSQAVGEQLEIQINSFLNTFNK